MKSVVPIYSARLGALIREAIGVTIGLQLPTEFTNPFVDGDIHMGWVESPVTPLGIQIEVDTPSGHISHLVPAGTNSYVIPGVPSGSFSGFIYNKALDSHYADSEHFDFFNDNG